MWAETWESADSWAWSYRRARRRPSDTLAICMTDNGERNVTGRSSNLGVQRGQIDLVGVRPVNRCRTRNTDRGRVAATVLVAMIDAVSPLFTATGIDTPIKYSGSVPAAVAGPVKLMFPVAAVPAPASASGPSQTSPNGSIKR